MHLWEACEDFGSLTKMLLLQACDHSATSSNHLLETCHFILWRATTSSLQSYYFIFWHFETCIFLNFGTCIFLQFEKCIFLKFATNFEALFNWAFKLQQILWLYVWLLVEDFVQSLDLLSNTLQADLCLTKHLRDNLHVKITQLCVKWPDQVFNEYLGLSFNCVLQKQCVKH